MRGIDASTGRALAGTAHIRQSIRDILSTPIGTRVHRRDYGSRLYQWVDMPLTPSTTLMIISEAARAIAQWEPRVRLIHLKLIEVVASSARFLLQLQDAETGQAFELEV